MKKPKCYNCKFASTSFKIVNLTYHICQDEKQYPKEKIKSGEISHWDTLMKFSDTCNNHQFKEKLPKTNG